MERKTMVPTKKVARVGTLSNGGGAAASDKTGAVEVSERRSSGKDSHWDFLDDIEAPMWVDLTQECQFAYQDRDDEWFNLSHPFHHCSSEQLISAFALASEGCTKLDLPVQEQCSPKLPCSVSRSRGKDYKSRKWEETNEKVVFCQQHPPNKLKDTPLPSISITKRVSSDRASSGKSLVSGDSQSDSGEKSSLTEMDAKNEHSEISSGLQELRLGSTSLNTAESNATSTITSAGSEKPYQKSLELSSQVPAQTGGFLSALKISLRKSCVTRQASRMQVPKRRQSEGRKSSSSKSSVGSSSTLDSDCKNLTTRDNKDMTPGSRNVPRDIMTSSNKVNIAKTSLTTNAKLRTGRSVLTSLKERNIQGKQRTTHSKVLAPHSVNIRSSAAASVMCKEKAVGTAGRQISAVAKENLPREKLMEAKMSKPRDVVQVQRVTSRKLPEKIGKSSRDVMQVQKVSGRKLPENLGKTKLVSEKEKLRGKGEGKPGTMVQRGVVHHFR